MKESYMNYSNYKPEADQHGGLIPTTPGEMYGNSHEVYDVYPGGYDDRDIQYGSYIAGDHFDEPPPPPTYSTSYHQLHPGVVVTSGDPGLSQDDPYGVGAAHPPQQQTPSPPLSDRAYVPPHQSAPPNNNNNNHHHLSSDVDGFHEGVVMAPSPSQTYSPSKDIYSTNNLYGTHVAPQQQLLSQQQQQPASAAPSSSNFNDYMRSSELDESSNRSIYVSSKMMSQQMENMSLTNPVNQTDGSGALPYHDPSPKPVNVGYGNPGNPGNHVNYGNYADYTDVNHPSLQPQTSLPQQQPQQQQHDLNVNPYGTLQSVTSRQNIDPVAMQQQQQQPAQPSALNHYGTLTLMNNVQQQQQPPQSPSRQMNHYGTLASINSSSLNNNRLPPKSQSSPYSQFNGGVKEDYAVSSGSLPRGVVNATPTMPYNYSPNNQVVPDSPSSNQSGGPILRQSLSQYPRSSPEGSGSYPMYGTDSANKSSDLRWRDPDLEEVVEYLSHDNEAIRANAAAYLQHLCYKDESTKNRARELNGIPPLIKLLKSDSPDVCRNACGALRNLSYRDRRHPESSDDNKRAIKNAEGIPDLVRLLRKTNDDEVRDLITGILWNLSSCEEIKKSIIDDALAVLVSHVVCQYAGWDTNQEVMRLKDIPWTDEIRNTSGILRNISSAGGREPAYRRKMRECQGLVESLLHIIRCAIHKSQSQASAPDSKAPIDNKCVENCMCTLRNLSYRTQEVDDPNYDQVPAAGASANGGVNGTNDSKSESSTGCFGAAGKGKKEDSQIGTYRPAGNQSVTFTRVGGDGGPPKGQELLWHPDTVKPYLFLLAECSNPSTLEAAAGAIQNLGACTWQPAVEIRAAVRKEKGLPFLVELLRIEDDRVVCAVAVALRNLAIDTRNRELIGKYAMRDLVAKIPTQGMVKDQRPSDDTLAAVLSILHEVIKKTSPFAVSLYEAGGVEKLVNITRSKGEYAAKVLKLAAQVLSTMWGFRELHNTYRKGGWNSSHFTAKTLTAASTTTTVTSTNAGGRSPGTSGPARSSPGFNASGAGGTTPPSGASTLARQNAPRGPEYDDRTLLINRGGGGGAAAPDGVNGGIGRRGVRNEGYSQGGGLPPPGAVHPMGEPLYAQVNKQRGMMGGGIPPGRLNDAHDPNSPHHQHGGGGGGGVDTSQGGDSWV